MELALTLTLSSDHYHTYLYLYVYLYLYTCCIYIYCIFNSYIVERKKSWSPLGFWTGTFKHISLVTGPWVKTTVTSYCFQGQQCTDKEYLCCAKGGEWWTQHHEHLWNLMQFNAKFCSKCSLFVLFESYVQSTLRMCQRGVNFWLLFHSE